MRASTPTGAGAGKAGAGTRNPAAEATHCGRSLALLLVNGCGVESTLGLALSRAGGVRATVSLEFWLCAQGGSVQTKLFFPKVCEQGASSLAPHVDQNKMTSKVGKQNR